MKKERKESSEEGVGKKEKKGKVSKDQDMIIESSEILEIISSFDELNLREELLRGVYAYGFDNPSAV